jgi:hypothetical protein
MDLSLLLALGGGVGIAAACGLRAFLPLLVLGLAARVGLVHLRPDSQWLAGDIALVALGAATVFEIAADKIPLVDHALDAIATVLRPLAAWMGVTALLVHWPSPLRQVVAVALAAGALTLHGAKAKLRLGSTGLTAGHANPLLSLAEDVIALLLAAAVLVPLLALLAVALVAWVMSRRRARTA